MRKIVFGLATLAFLAAGAAQAADKIRVGIEGAFPPWNSTNAQGQLIGMDVDVIHDLCKRAQLDCDLVSGPWSGMVPGLVAGKYDAIMTVGINADRKKIIDFTTPYGIGAAGFVVPAGSKLAKMPMTGEHLNLNDKAKADPVMAKIGKMLKGTTIGVVASTSQEKLIKAYFGNEVTIRTYQGSPARDLDLKAGRLDAGFDSAIYETANFKGAKADTSLVMTGPLFRGAMLATDVAIGVQKGNDALRQKLNAAIKAAAADGTLKRISEQWAGLNLSPAPGTK